MAILHDKLNFFFFEMFPCIIGQWMVFQFLDKVTNYEPFSVNAINDLRSIQNNVKKNLSHRFVKQRFSKDKRLKLFATINIADFVTIIVTETP